MQRRLLFVTDVKLLPVDQGMRVRVSNLLGGCARGFDVTLVGPPPDDPADRRTIEQRYARVVWLGEQQVDDLRGRLSTWWTTVRAAPGLRINAAWYGRYAAALHGLDLASFDLIWAERPHIARLFPHQRARTIIDFDDIEHRRVWQELKLKGSRAKPGELWRYALYRRWELSWSQGFLATVVCSEEDRHYLESKGCRNVAVVPNGINDAACVAREPREARSAEGPLRMVFLGNIAHPPNLDALEFFAADILPLLRKTYPDVVLDVIGPSATPELRARFAGQARFLGFVPDLGAALSEYEVLVAPIRFGSGTRVKLLDAMACRIPIVTTGPGAEGLPVVDGEQMLLASGAEDFAAKVLRVKRDPALGRRLVESGTRLVDERYRSAAIQQQLASWIDGLVKPS